MKQNELLIEVTAWIDVIILMLGSKVYIIQKEPLEMYISAETSKWLCRDGRKRGKDYIKKYTTIWGEIFVHHLDYG